jgi:hypothetical protein
VYKLRGFFLLLFIFSAFLSSIMEGGAGFAATKLSAPAAANAATISVDSTAGFLTADYIIIGDEQILYTGITPLTFTGCTRGHNGTTAVAHNTDESVYTSDASAINTAMGFNINATRDAYGAAAIVAVPINFFRYTIPHIVSMNFSFMTGELAILSWFFFGSGIAFIITLAISIVGGLRT